ncbi:transmembrane protein, putative (macronuclear) [Tetrahymena thermophila SB210]|uniref:Transmembrane protein, putative n=1 Tax=Tetrahymena thermophila (strain SB210) TaxID=312017 RepID=Q23NG6_TETTS|nr:transmembrane protein, putative [Tetrahymena thermophila SB210]EAR98108.1 transmembrane protein, putative [Tetrahymena thermophila SB210]|eukprot:XP_001018353.1 transmembrane protein, putative [Tetrahymena thermophila SB210]
MKQFALLFLAFVAITTVNAYISKDQIYQFNNCTEKIQLPCDRSNTDCLKQKAKVEDCLDYCFDGNWNTLSMGDVNNCYQDQCIPYAKNSTQSTVRTYASQLGYCLSSGIISFAFILLAVIVSVLFVQH